MNPRASFTPLSGSEYETAVALLVESGFEPEEFVLEEQRFESPAASPGHQVSKLVSVIRLRIGLHRRYTAGAAGTWPGEFERDLRCGTYGEPATAAARHGFAPAATGLVPTDHAPPEHGRDDHDRAPVPRHDLRAA
jgi:hypothetical protein